MVQYIAASLLALVGIAYFANPFSRFSTVRRPFTAEMINDALKIINKNHKLKIYQNIIERGLGYCLCGLYILNTRYINSPGSRSNNVDGIIRDIHKLRFNPKKLLLTSGDHFSSLFVRNLGVFYYPTLDTSVVSSKKEWHNRQICYLQTVAYALGVFAKQKTLTTTITPLGRWSATCINFYAYPSDTLYGILYALAALSGKEKARAEDYSKTNQAISTIPATTLLLDEYHDSLVLHYDQYRRTVYDPATGLIKTSLHMSGAKDITRRESSFYDNVVFWKTTQLAMTLGLIKKDQAFLDKLKKRIIEKFWLDKKGYFLEDLSAEGVKNHYYSSDWLIVLATGFLHPKNPRERKFFTRSISHIIAHKIDQPFAIKYQSDTRAHRQFLAVRIAVASYGGDSIWSFWGMEYIKVLMLLYKYTGEKSYLDTADYHIEKYQQKMIEYHGYPEVYDQKGRLLQTLFYRSIRQTGWVIGFEQVLAMRQNLK